MNRLWAIGLGAILSLCFSSSAHAAARDVVVINGGSSFREAVSVALSSWDLRVVPAGDAPPPSTEAPRAAREARAIADRMGAAGVIWIGGHDREQALLVYDADTD